MRSLDVHRACVTQKVGHQAIQTARLLFQDPEEGLVVFARNGLLAEARDGVCDDGKGVSDLVRDDRRELADDRELLLLDELLLGGPEVLV